MSIASKHAYRFKFLKSEKWSNVRLEALAREGGKCEICKEESIHNDAHHIWYPKEIYDTKAHQLAVLCRPCHNFLHVMLPECKTNIESDGIAQWLKYKNAIISWRLEKLNSFSESEDSKKALESQLLNSRLLLEKALLVKQKFYQLPSPKGIITLKRSDVGHLFAGLTAISKQITNGTPTEQTLIQN